MPIQCPHCRSSIVTEGKPSREAVCPSCGTNIQLDPDATAGWLPEEAPKRLGKFELLEQVGIGAFGTVYKARDTELDRLVAVKIPRSGSIPKAEDMDRFLREARSAAQLKHPSIVSLYDAGHIDGACCLVSEFIQGATLAERLSAKRLSFRQAAELIVEVADALHYAHQHGVVHRDIKPSNIMLDLEGRPHLMDFGLAKRAADEITMTLEGQVLGTPAYMSPEQAKGEVRRVDARSDLYSLGVILYELLTGELPFHGETRMLVVQVIQDEPRPPRRLNDRIPRDLETICLKAMAKEPARRYPTARDLADDLRRFLKGEPIQARPVGQVERFRRWCRRKPLVAALTLAVTVLLVAITLGSTLFALRLTRERDQRARAERERVLEFAQLLLTTASDDVPHIIDRLQSFPELVQPVLASRFADPSASPKERLRAACGLGALGEAHVVDHLRDSIPEAPAPESRNIINALAPRADSVTAPMFQRCRLAATPRAKIRFAIVLLELGDPRAAQQMLALAPDPEFRSGFIREFALWHGELAAVPELLRTCEGSSFRSGSCAALGAIKLETVKAETRRALVETTLHLYRTAPDGATHSASGWALRKWNVELPACEQSQGPVAGRQWFVNRQDMTMIKVPAGIFMMGDTCPVFLSRPFFMCDREVWVGLYQRFLADPDYPSDQKLQADSPHRTDVSPTDDCPMQNMTWTGAVLFCNWLSHREGRTKCYELVDKQSNSWRCDFAASGYRLPTEAEWEYALRAGTTTLFITGREPSGISSYGNMELWHTCPGGSYLPNAWGLFDMLANVWETCWDWGGPLPQSLVVDPPGPAVGSHRVSRGGGFSSGSFDLPSNRRLTSSVNNEHLGFRVVCSSGDQPVGPDQILEEHARNGHPDTKVFSANQEDRQLLIERGKLFARWRRWDLAAFDYARASDLDPSDVGGWYNQAPLLLYVGDQVGYRRICREMLKHFGDTDDPAVAERVAKTCFLAADAVEDPQLPARLAGYAVTKDRNHVYIKWFRLAEGLADYRGGSFDQAVHELEEALSPGSEDQYLDATAQVVLAMAHHRLGQADGARRAMEKARRLAEQRIPKLETGADTTNQFRESDVGANWADWLRFQILRREAEKLLATGQ